MDQIYKTVLVSDNKGRITIPVKIREMLNGEKGNLIYNLEYDQLKNELVLVPIGVNQLTE